MIMPSRVADAEVVAALVAGEVIGDDVAQTIAARLQSAAAVDEPLCALAHGREFDGAALVQRVTSLMTSSEYCESDFLPDLHVLREWALCRVPHLMIEEYEISGEAWSAWQRYGAGRGRDGASGLDRPEGTRRIDRYAVLVSEACESLAEWVSPGDDRYPAEPYRCALEDRQGEERLVRPSLVTGAVALLFGVESGFWAQSYGRDPFDPARYWWRSDDSGFPGVGLAYGARCVNLYSGEARVFLARFGGLSDEQSAGVYREWRREFGVNRGE